MATRLGDGALSYFARLNNFILSFLSPTCLYWGRCVWMVVDTGDVNRWACSDMLSVPSRVKCSFSCWPDSSICGPLWPARIVVSCHCWLVGDELRPSVGPVLDPFLSAHGQTVRVCIVSSLRSVYFSLPTTLHLVLYAAILLTIEMKMKHQCFWLSLLQQSHFEKLFGFSLWCKLGPGCSWTTMLSLTNSGCESVIFTCRNLVLLIRQKTCTYFV